MGTSGASDNSEEKVVNIEVRDSVIGEFEVSQIKKNDPQRQCDQHQHPGFR